jgi:hypothetical protein
MQRQFGSEEEEKSVRTEEEEIIHEEMGLNSVPAGGVPEENKS